MRNKRKKTNRKKIIKQNIFKKCPNGGYCANPLCMFGCIDR